MTTTTASITITVPMPPACCSPNVRAHWAKRASAVRGARQGAKGAVQAKLQHYVGVGWPTGPCTLSWVVRGPTKQDGDNVKGRMKAVWDGIADALLVNDRDFTIEPPRFEKRGKGGNKYRLADPTDVEITITPTAMREERLAAATHAPEGA